MGTVRVPESAARAWALAASWLRGRPVLLAAVLSSAASLSVAYVLHSLDLRARRRRQISSSSSSSSSPPLPLHDASSPVVSIQQPRHALLHSPRPLHAREGGGEAVNDLNRFTGSPAPLAGEHGARRHHARKEDEEEELFREQLGRNVAFLGEDGMRKVRGAFVVVIGAGGVGSHAAHMLLRAGVGRLRLVDFDQVTLSSLNRHAVATRADVGTPKVVAMRKHFARVLPAAQIDIRVDLFDRANADGLLAGAPDFVLDCIDNMTTKVDLLGYCHDRNIKVISSMGAAARADPTSMQIADISQTSEDPLAKNVRIRLAKEYKITSGIPCVFSTEKPRLKLLPPHDVDAAEEYAALPSFRVGILPVLGTLPAIFGMAMANYVLCELSAFGNEPLFLRNQAKEWRDHFIKLGLREMERTGTQRLPLEPREIGYLHDEVFRARSALSGAMNRLAFTRWDLARPPHPDNLVLLTRDEADAHERGGGHAQYDAPTRKRIEDKIAVHRAWTEIWR